MALLERASGLPSLLDAAFEVFSHALTEIRAAEDSAGSLLPALVMAAAAAADGRDAISRAPALPPAGRDTVLPATVPGAAATTADRVAGIALALQSRLASAPAENPADREACDAAAGYAATIHQLLAG